MKTWLSMCIPVLVILVGCDKQQGSDVRAGTLDVLATESLLPLIQRQAEEYHHVFSEARVNVRGTTTREAIVHMVNDSVHCIVVDRPLNPEERTAVRQAGLRVLETEIARDALAILIHSSNKTASLSVETLRSIVAGTMTDWHEVPGSKLTASIELCFTGRNSGLYELLTQHFFRLEKDAIPSFVAPSQSSVIEYVAAHPLALGVISFAAWKDTTRASDQRFKKYVHLLDAQTRGKEGMEAVKLHQKNIYDLVYPLTYSLYAYTSEKSPGVGQGFSTFVAGMTGQKVFLDAGLVPKIMPYRVIQLTQE